MLIWVDGTHWVEAEVLAPAQGRTIMAAPHPHQGHPEPCAPCPEMPGLDYFLSLISVVQGEHSHI